MARKTVTYVCQECGAVAPKWSGRCEGCGAWNTLVEEQAPESTPKGLGSKKGRKIEFQGLKGKTPHAPRQVTGIKEFDRVTGGGMVAGSTLLVGGDPARIALLGRLGWIVAVEDDTVPTLAIEGVVAAGHRHVGDSVLARKAAVHIVVAQHVVAR